MLEILKDKKYRKFVGGIGFGAISLASFGCIQWERHKINNYLSKLIDTSVLDVDKKRPDYIYIKYHIYRESMRKMKRKQEMDAYWINVIINPFSKWWKTFKHSVAWRLLNIAQNGDKHERLKAIRQLASINHLKDWDFRHLAQICEARTAISLARSNCDNRWFIEPHKSGILKNPKFLLNEIKNILKNIEPNQCILNALKNFDKNFGHIKDVDSNEMYYIKLKDVASQIKLKEVDFLKECIVILNHITKDINVSKMILNQEGLIILLELHKFFGQDNETLATICKVLSNLALVDGSEYDFFVTGWVGILAQWQNHKDVRLQIISSKVLTNLDRDDRYPTSYPPNIYALYPRTRQICKPKLDVIFIHGLLGGVFYTWRQKDRKSPNELGLYGKNAFYYTSESDDVFLIGEAKKLKNSYNGINNKKKFDNNANNLKQYKDSSDMNRIQQESIVTTEAPIISKRRKKKKKSSSGISDLATKELVESLEASGELDSDWEIVYPDCPLNSNTNEYGDLYSCSGDQWINDDNSDEYTNCWPMDWLPEDYPNIRILGVDYTSAVTQWSANYVKACPCEKGHGTLENRSKTLFENLVEINVGDDHPVVWVGHSMGGLLCKLILLKSLSSNEEKIRNIAKNSKGIIFLGTPHKGSPIARWKQHMQLILSPSIEVKELEENAPPLIYIHDEFMKKLKTTLKNLKIISICEGQPTMLTTFKFPLTIVNENSANINYGDFYILKDDHLSLSKPIFRQSFLYQKILRLINESINKNSDDKNILGKYDPDDMGDENVSHKLPNLLKWKILRTLPEYLNKIIA